MSGSLQEFKRDLADMITDFINDNVPEFTCSRCPDNHYDSEIDYSDCEVMQETFDCPYGGLLSNAVLNAVEAIAGELPDPPEELFF